MRIEQSAPGAGNPDAPRRLISVEQPDAVLQAKPTQRFVCFLYTWYLARATGDAELSAAEVLGVDLLRPGYPAYFLDRLPHLQQELPRGRSPKTPLELPRADRKARRAPGPVAPGSPEAGDLRLEHHHLQRRLP